MKDGAFDVNVIAFVKGKVAKLFPKFLAALTLRHRRGGIIDNVECKVSLAMERKATQKQKFTPTKAYTAFNIIRISLLTQVA